MILAAGKGSRLYPVTHHIPKPLLPLANRPTLEYAVERLKELGIREIAIVVGENEPQMREAMGTGSHLGVSLDYVRQMDPKGLAHAVGFAKDFVGGDDFALYLGDAIYGSGFQAAYKRFKESGCANLNLVKPVPDPERFGVAMVEGDRIVRLVEKPKQPESNLAMAGMYFFGPQIWRVLPDLQPSGRGEYEITDAIQMLIDQGETVLASTFESEWFDTGTLDSYLATSQFLTKGKGEAASDSIVNAAVSGGSVIGAGCRVDANEVVDSVILPGSTIKVSGSIRHCILMGEVVAEGDLTNVIAYNDERS